MVVTHCPLSSGPVWSQGKEMRGRECSARVCPGRAGRHGIPGSPPLGRSPYERATGAIGPCRSSKDHPMPKIKSKRTVNQPLVLVAYRWLLWAVSVEVGSSNWDKGKGMRDDADKTNKHILTLVHRTSAGGK